MIEKIKNVEFIDDECTRVRFTIVNETKELTHLAELTVPENYQTGVNKYWDLILQEHSLENLIQEKQEKKQLLREEERLREEKIKSNVEARELRELFDLKSFCIKMPFAETDQDKSIIRKAPNKISLHFVVLEMMKNYVNKHNLEMEDFFDQIEDSIYNDNDQ